MLKLSKVILNIMYFTILFGCSLEKSVDSDTVNISDNTQVEVKMLRINPLLQSQVNELPQSRAYAISDKLKVTVKKGDEVIKEAEFEAGENLYYYDLSLSLPEGTGYKMFVKSYNLANSAEIPTTVGESGLFDIIKGNKTSINLIMLPYNPQVINLGDKISFEPKKYTAVSSVLANILYSVASWGEESWYKVKAETNYLEIITNKITVFGEMDGEWTNPSSFIEVFNSDGTSLGYSSRSDANDTTIIYTVPGEEYYICILPKLIKEDNNEFKSDIIEFYAQDYIDANSSEITAREIELGYFQDSYNGSIDEDYFKVYLDAGSYSLYNEVPELSIYSEAKVSIVESTSFSNLFFDIKTSGYYYLKCVFSSEGVNSVGEYYMRITPFVVQNTLNPSESWSELYNNNSEERNFYKLNVDPKKEYILSIKRTNDINEFYSNEFSIFTLDPLERNGSYFKQTIFTDIDRGSGIAKYVLDIPPGDDLVYLGYDIHNNGGFAVQLEEVTPEYKPVTIGSNWACDPAEGDVQYYSFDVTPGQKLILNSEGDGVISIYDIDKTQYVKTEINYKNQQTFEIKPGVSRLIIKVIQSPDNIHNNDSILFSLREESAAQ